MRLDWTLFALPLALASPLLNSSDVSAAPPATEEKALLSRWIITLNKGFILEDVLDSILPAFGIGRSNLIYTYNLPDYHGFALEIPNLLLEISLPDVFLPLPSIKSVEKDYLATISTISTQNNAPYGLARLSTRANATGTTYSYDSTAGAGAFAYVVDTVRCSIASLRLRGLQEKTSDHLVLLCVGDQHTTPGVSRSSDPWG